jgi:hypothetical protein
MPITAPCLCTKSTTAVQNASLVDCPHNDLGKCVDRFTAIVLKMKRFLVYSKETRNAENEYIVIDLSLDGDIIVHSSNSRLAHRYPGSMRTKPSFSYA